MTCLPEFVWFQPDKLAIFDHLVISAKCTLRLETDTPYVPSMAESTAMITCNGATACNLIVAEPGVAGVGISYWSGMKSNVQDYIGRACRVDVGESAADVSFLTMTALGAALASASSGGLNQLAVAFFAAHQKVVALSTAGAHFSVA